uniref:Uncharacterized protein n=1 Tax=Arundo donax TaxID=35708 RepID=A0A0A9DVK2_ARUDO
MLSIQYQLHKSEFPSSFFSLTGARRLQVAPDPSVRRLEPVGRHARHSILPVRDLLLRSAGGERRGPLQGASVPCQALQLQEVCCASEGRETKRCACEEGGQEAVRE